MLTGFEKETAPLTAEEREKLLPLFIAGFKAHTGKEKAIKEAEIAKAIKTNLGINVSGARFRKIVNYIRVNNCIPGFVLISTSKGYWLSADESEIMECAKSLNERGAAIINVSKAIERSLQLIKSTSYNLNL